MEGEPLKKPGLVLLLLLASPAWAASRPADWAQPLSACSLANAYRVSPELYRSGQFKASDLPALQALGIRTIVSLRNFHGDQGILSPAAMKRFGIQRYVALPFTPAHPRARDARRFLALLRDPATPKPVLLHCMNGSDRTGAFCALYRVEIQGWERETAIREMTDGGYGFNPVWKGLPEFVRKYRAAGP